MPASAVSVVFLDDGGVLNDNDRRAVEWRRLLGEFFAPRLGGTPDAWAQANSVVYEGIWDDWRLLQQRGEDPGPSWWPDQDERWLGGMCQRVGVPIPIDVPATVRASRAYVMAHIDCAYPDAAPAIRAIHAMGITLHLASGGQTHELEPYLRRMGVRELIDRPYGADLLGANKLGRRYYGRIAED
ncbi:MAG TPA: HAD family hydrolase, partial [Candidatus Limnocylindria bacterium]